MNTNTGGPAFPSHGSIHQGMTLRDYFAGHALAHITVLIDAHEENKSVAIIADWSYMVADAMIASRMAYEKTEAKRAADWDAAVVAARGGAK
jgi:hypothetical protein